MVTRNAGIFKRDRDKMKVVPEGEEAKAKKQGEDENEYLKSMGCFHDRRKVCSKKYISDENYWLRKEKSTKRLQKKN